jgi:hypothetical protein
MQINILLILKFLQSKKNSCPGGLNFIEVGGKEVFLLYK